MKIEKNALLVIFALLVFTLILMYSYRASPETHDSENRLEIIKENT